MSSISMRYHRMQLSVPSSTWLAHPWQASGDHCRTKKSLLRVSWIHRTDVICAILFFTGPPTPSRPIQHYRPRTRHQPNFLCINETTLPQLCHATGTHVPDAVVQAYSILSVRSIIFRKDRVYCLQSTQLCPRLDQRPTF